jgi:hypothetical protein
MSQRFGLNQGTRDNGQYAEVTIPSCGTQTQDNGPVIFIEFENNKPILYIWADINQEDWTHRIELKDALEGNREERGMSDVGKAENGSG